jgi:hypothetical protein
MGSTGLFIEHVIEVELCRIAVFEFGNLAGRVLLRLLNLPG